MSTGLKFVVEILRQLVVIMFYLLRQGSKA